LTNNCGDPEKFITEFAAWFNENIWSKAVTTEDKVRARIQEMRERAKRSAEMEDTVVRRLARFNIYNSDLPACLDLLEGLLVERKQFHNDRFVSRAIAATDIALQHFAGSEEKPNE